MTLTFTIGGAPLPLPRYDQPYDSEYLGFGTHFRTLDTTLKTQHMGAKWRFRIYWVGLSATERTTLIANFSTLLTVASSLVFPDGAAFMVSAILGSWNERVWYNPHNDIPYYDVSFQVEQV